MAGLLTEGRLVYEGPHMRLWVRLGWKTFGRWRNPTGRCQNHCRQSISFVVLFSMGLASLTGTNGVVMLLPQQGWLFDLAGRLIVDECCCDLLPEYSACKNLSSAM